ncbi:helicase [Aureococcus anophagefferens]|nr:helicase [Aureococcus anophagefferens]
MELRKCVNHPLLLAGVRDASREALQDALLAETGAGAVAPAAFEAAAAERLLVAGSGKMVFLDKLLPRLRSEGRKVLVFSQFVRVLGLVAELCAHRGYDAEALTGATPAADRQRAIDRFNASPDAFVFLLSTRAGGVGINLCAADTVVIYDSDWNPQNDVQAMARCHRLGQTRDVAVYRLVARKSFEGHMLEAAARKLGLERAVMGAARRAPRSSSGACASAAPAPATTPPTPPQTPRSAPRTSTSSARRAAGPAPAAASRAPGDAVDVDDPDFWAKAMPHMVTPELVAARLDADVGAAAASPTTLRASRPRRSSAEPPATSTTRARPRTSRSCFAAPSTTASPPPSGAGPRTAPRRRGRRRRLAPDAARFFYVTFDDDTPAAAAAALGVDAADVVRLNRPRLGGAVSRNALMACTPLLLPAASTARAAAHNAAAAAAAAAPPPPRRRGAPRRRRRRRRAAPRVATFAPAPGVCGVCGGGAGLGALATCGCGVVAPLRCVSAALADLRLRPLRRGRRGTPCATSRRPRPSSTTTPRPSTTTPRPSSSTSGPSRRSFAGAGARRRVARALAALRSGTLDEPVAETLLRDARESRAARSSSREPGGAERLKEWDLWGPLAVCLLLGVALSASAPEAQGGLAFAAAFVVVWLGAAAVTLNAQLLGGALSFFQAVCVLGYSVFPLALAALAGLPLRAATASRLARAAVVAPCFAWSTRVSVVFFGEVIGPAKRALATYPVFLFYAFLSFMILIN